MAIYTTNLTIYIGTDFDQVFVLEDNGGSMYLNGYTIISKIKKNPLSLTSKSFNCSIIDVFSGKIKILMNANETAQLNPGKYLYDIVLYKDGITTRIIEGEIFVKRPVTRY